MVSTAAKMARAASCSRWVRLLVALLMLVVALGASRARALAPERFDVEARVDVETGDVDELVRIDVRVEQEREVRLWLYGDRLAVTPRAMDGRTARWIYPGEVSRGGFDLVEVRVDGAAVATTRVPVSSANGGDESDAAGTELVVPIASDSSGARTVRIEVRARLHVPDRFGRLGRAGGRLSLAGPWYPLVVVGEGWAFDAPHEVHVRVVHGVAASPEGAIGAEHRVAMHGAFVPLLAGARLRRREVAVDGDHALVVIDAFDGNVRPPRDAEGEFGVWDVTGIDREALLARAARDADGTLAWLVAPRRRSTTVLVVPSRTELAASAPGVVLVSDRIFQVTPLDELVETHLAAVRRALFSLAADDLASHDEPADRGWATDLRGAVLEELDVRRRRGGRQEVGQLLQPFSFHPAVDQLLYAPQVTFEGAYFSTLDEPDAFRDAPERARAPWTRGRRLAALVADEVGEPAMQRVAAMLVHGRRSARDAIERAAPGTTRWLADWLGYASTSTNYRLGAVQSARTESGYRHTIEVLREGDPRHERVVVDVEDAHGEHATGTWDGLGERGVVVIETQGEASRVVIDPDQHTSESAAVAEGHPRADDATSQPWRLPMFNNFSLDLLLSENNFTGLADVTLRQRYDLEHTLVLRLARTVARTTGRIRYLQGFGPKVHTNRRSMQAGGSLAFSRVEPGFGGSVLGGWSLEVEGLVLLSTQSYVNDPREGVYAMVQLAGAATLRDDGSIAGTARGAFHVSWVLPLSLQNALVFVAGGGFTAGPALDADRQVLGGRYGLRGFANGELLGNGALFGVVEHRATLLSDLAINVFHGVWARELQLAWWAGAGGVFDTPARETTAGVQAGEAARFAAEVGVGLRAHYEYGGVQPGLLAVDVGFPVSRYLDGTAGNPVAFYLSFDQYY